MVSARASSYLIKVDEDIIIDGIKEAIPGLGGASLANDALGTGVKPNCKFEIKAIKGERKVWLKALRRIRRGAELLKTYGSEFWRLNIRRGRRTRFPKPTVNQKRKRRASIAL